MAKKTTKSIKKAAINAALALAAEQGWNKTDLPDIAKKAKIPLAELKKHFSDKTDILAAYGDIVDERTAKAAGTPDPDLSPRDRLFDIIMERFDIINEQRDGLRAILRAAKCQPKQALTGLPHLGKSMRRMLALAGVETDSAMGALKTAGLTVVYLKTLWVWYEDDSPDMAKTMAALDKSLGYAETLMSLVISAK